ncbi:hypothetical protein K7X08_022189 [Anisodus acutangulus]|uniref:Uncharacterized protein n=1 Tax=Anisodus acutangulus TaxID=402998 RepID=A0A9Q1QW19_9SOLA|nr:hypothetical protein K7X08_022189 [Anisodus acutangulus]
MDEVENNISANVSVETREAGAEKEISSAANLEGSDVEKNDVGMMVSGGMNDGSVISHQHEEREEIEVLPTEHDPLQASSSTNIIPSLSDVEGEPAEELSIVQKENISVIPVHKKSSLNKELRALVSHDINVLQCTLEELPIKENLKRFELDKVEEEDILQKMKVVAKQADITPKGSVNSSKKGNKNSKDGGDVQQIKGTNKKASTTGNNEGEVFPLRVLSKRGASSKANQ